LIKLFQRLNIDIGKPSQPNANAPTFFTNAILGIKKNGMSSKVKAIWEKESTEEFLKPLIEIIQPKIIITLGKVAYYSITNKNR
jgi:uracil-DNA glycosylase